MKKLLFLTLFAGAGAFLSAQNTPASSPADTVKISEFVGAYTFTEGFSNVSVSQKNGSLYGEVDSYGIYQLIPQKNADTFKSTSSYGTLYIFKRGADNKISGLTLQLMGQEVTGEKKK